MQRSFQSASSTASTSASASGFFETQPGTVLVEQFRLERRLSSGGMGTVWIADDLNLHRQVAIKFLARWEWDGEFAHQRFEREAILAGKLRSPHVVQIFGQGRSADGRPFIVMELLTGEDLAKRIARDGALSAELTLSILEQTTRALGEAHRQGLVHRDIKPHNIFLLEDQCEGVFVKLLDFGIAKDTHTPFTKLTLTGAFIGTLLYVSPEQLTDPHRVGSSADVWGMAVTTYQMLTGEVPYDRSATLPELLLKICRGEFVPATTVHRGLPRSVDSVFHRAFQVDPQLRFASMEDFTRALTDSLRGNSHSWSSAALQARKSPQRVADVREAKSAAKSRQRAVIATAVVVLTALGWVFSQHKKPLPPPNHVAEPKQLEHVAPRPAPPLAPANKIAHELEEVPTQVGAPEATTLPLGAAAPEPLELPARRKPMQEKTDPEKNVPASARADLVNYGF